MSYALFIDDDEPLLETLRTAATSAGLELTTAATWDDGLALFHTLSPELVIADYNLPGSAHGLQLLAEVRRLRPSVRLLLVSGVVGTDALDEAQRIGAAHRVLAKTSDSIPVILEEIERASLVAKEHTDWRAFACAYVEARDVPDAEIALLDEGIQRDLPSQT